METGWTGERLEPHITNETMFEHLHRYAAASELVNGKWVLDIACGEGYGANLLAAKAEKVTGIDIDRSVIEKARKKYLSSKVEFGSGSITNIPAASGTFDVITCFETLEHTEEHEAALQELKRVLKPGGILLISTPDKANYADKTGYKNPYHKKELYSEEFKTLVKQFFAFTFFCGQGAVSGSLMQSGQAEEISSAYSGKYDHIKKGFLIEPLYWVAYASDKSFDIPATSLFYYSANISQQLAQQEASLKKTITYRVGHFILAPFKFFRSLIKR